jgi:hypothetical protein
MRSPGQYDFHQAASSAGTVGDFDPPPVGFRDLTREYKSNSTATGLCCVERSENIRGIQQTGAVVFDEQVYVRVVDVPSHPDLPI